MKVLIYTITALTFFLAFPLRGIAQDNDKLAELERRVNLLEQWVNEDYDDLLDRVQDVDKGAATFIDARHKQSCERYYFLINSFERYFELGRLWKEQGLIAPVIRSSPWPEYWKNEAIHLGTTASGQDLYAPKWKNYFIEPIYLEQYLINAEQDVLKALKAFAPECF
ncbi:hypothetical protein ACFLRA_03225 [Bdellovibrionota bacterium]